MTEDKSEIVIILDIDETLVYATKNRLELEHDFVLGDYFVYKRPRFHEFIDFVNGNFRFATWSSATDSYVHEMNEKLGLNEKAIFCWARSKATIKRPSLFDADGDLNIDSIDQHYYVKRLKKVKKLGFDLNKIVIIDDTPRKSQENYGNAIYVSEFKGDKNDNELLELTEYLKKLKRVDNVRVLEKRNWKETLKHEVGDQPW